MNKLAFIFPGQGAQYVGMGKDLYNNFKEARNIFDEADKALNEKISKICFEGPEEKLQETVNTQPAILTHSMTCFSILKAHGIIPDIVAGLSIGEYSALVAAESIKFEQAVPLVQKRGRFMQEAVPLGEGSMAAILGLTKEEVLEICNTASKEGIVEAANFNCPGQIVIAGEAKAVSAAIELAKEKGAKKAIPLSVSAPFHCSLMKPAAEKLSVELEKVDIANPKIPVVANVNAEIVSSSNAIKEFLIRQVYSPVFWEDCVKKMMDFGADVFVEVGPGKALSGFVKKISKDVTVLNAGDSESLQKTINYFGG